MNVVDYLFEKSCVFDKECILGSSETISYSALYKNVNDMSSYISDTFGAGNNILLLSENSIFFVVNYLAIIKSGNTVVLVETQISDVDLKMVIDTATPVAFFVEDNLKNKVSGEYIFTENDKDVFKERKKALPKSKDNTNINNVALIIFTSGSTGGKKGVMLTHKNIMANTESIIAYLKLTENDRMEIVLPFFYCYGLSLLHTYLRVGGSMVLNRSIFLGSVIDEMKKYKCTGFAGVPSTFQILINKTNFLNQSFPSLRYMTQAGGKLANVYIKKIIDSFPSKQFFVMYGATEATARLSYLDPNIISDKLGSIGKGIDGVTLEVVNEHGKNVKNDEIGEIVASGDNIMKGYYKDFIATKEVIKDGRYYTGDLATVDEDGFIYIVGRKKNIIKSGGYRVSPYEIENIINNIDKISDCIVMGIPDDILGEGIATLVETEHPSQELKKEIISLCKKMLPSYKVPKKICFSNTLPRNASNKIDIPKARDYCLKYS